MTDHQASCQCGSLVIAAQGEPDFVIACNCRACQKRTGAPLGTAAYFRRDALTHGGDRTGWSRKADTGREVETFFCPTCGTSVYWTLEMRPDHIGVALGAFDTELRRPDRAIWTEEQHDWLHFAAAMPTFPKGTPET